MPEKVGVPEELAGGGLGEDEERHKEAYEGLKTVKIDMSGGLMDRVPTSWS